MPSLPASSAEPRHVRGGAGGVRPRRNARRAGQEIEVPERVYRGPHYTDAFKKIWCKGAALDLDANEEHCNASVARMAEFSNVSKSSAERALTQGRHPGPDGGAPEFTTTRKTHRGGRGRTAIREVRGIAWGETFVTVPGWIADAAEPRELAAVLLIAHAEKTGHQLTAAELAGELFHHHAKRKGEALSERTARRLIHRLEAKGFIDVGHRAGYQGRDVITVRRSPLEVVPDSAALPHPAETAGADIHDGSGPDSRDGSLASKEDSGVCTDGMAQVGGSFRRRRGDRKWVAPPVDNSGSSVASVAPAVFRAPTAPPARPQDGRTYDGPALALSPRVWDVLEPVHDLLPSATTFMVRKIAREVGRQLDAGIWPEDIRDQLTRLRAWTPPETITDPGRWIYGAALPARPGPCGRPGCHYGFQHHTGLPCKACADARAHPPPPAWHECADCRRPARQPLPAGLCHTCQPAPPHTA